jgi:hypothetical protein
MRRPLAKLGPDTKRVFEKAHVESKKKWGMTVLFVHIGMQM